MEQATVKAYDASGNVRVPTPVKIGDIVEWKRHGAAGVYKCRVLGFNETNSGRLNIRVLLLSHDGRPIHGGRYITDRNILRVIPQEARAA